jgi:choline dehydrogenase-like flavoprotein
LNAFHTCLILIQSREFLQSAHATTGLLGTSLPSISVSLDDRVIGVTSQLAEFPYRQDMNAGTPLGVGWTQSSIAQGNRTNSYSAYLHPFLARPNLAVLGGAHVTRVVQTGTSRGVPIFRGVEFATSAHGPSRLHVRFSLVTDPRAARRINVTARKEVILAAGAFNTPQILMLSGIGDTSTLSRAGVRPIVNLPSVGQNMSDHVFLANKFQVHANDTFNTVEEPANLAPALAQWEKTHDGPVSDSGFRQLAFLRVPSNNTLFKKHADPSAGPTSAHYEFAFVVSTIPYS